MDIKELNEKQKKTEEKFSTIKTPIKYFLKSFYCTMHAIENYSDILKSCIDDIDSEIEGPIISRSTINRLGDILIEIQDFWDIFGTILLSIRAYSSNNYADKYKNFHNVIDEDIFTKAINNLKNYVHNINFMQYEYTDFLDEAQSKLLKFLMDYKRNCDTYFGIKNISNDNLSNEYWAFKESMNSSFSKFEIIDSNNNEEEIEKYVEFLFEIKSSIKDEYELKSDDKVSLHELNDKINIIEFCTISINYFIKTSYDNLIKYVAKVYEKIDKMNEKSEVKYIEN